MRPRGVLKAFDGRGEVFLALLTGGSVLFRHDASGFLAPARLTAFENLRQPAAEHLAAPTNSASGDFCQRLDGSILLSSTGLASSGAASSLFFLRGSSRTTRTRATKTGSAGRALGFLGHRPESAGHAVRDYLGVDGISPRDAGKPPVGLLLGISWQMVTGVSCA